MKVHVLLEQDWHADETHVLGVYQDKAAAEAAALEQGLLPRGEQPDDTPRGQRKPEYTIEEHALRGPYGQREPVIPDRA